MCKQVDEKVFKIGNWTLGVYIRLIPTKTWKLDVNIWGHLVCLSFVLLFICFCLSDWLTFHLFEFLASVWGTTFLLSQVSFSTLWILFRIHCHIGRPILHSVPVLFSLFLTKHFWSLILCLASGSQLSLFQCTFRFSVLS